MHLFSVGMAEDTETGATAFCRWVSVLNILHENLETIRECSSPVILVCGSFTVLMLRVSHSILCI